MTKKIHLTATATAVPPFALHQQEVMERAQFLFGQRGLNIDRLLPVYGNAGIETRYSCVPIDWYQEGVGWKERNRLFVDNAVPLLREAAEKCLSEVNMQAGEIDTLVVVSTSGIATPSLDARLMESMPFRRDVQRLPIFGLGCAGGVIGLARAAALASAQPGSRVLFLVVELCGLTFRTNDLSKSNVIATALFGDGAAAALITCDNGAAGPTLTGWGEHTWPDSLDVMGWRIEEDGFGVQFSRDIPAIVHQHYAAAVDHFLAGQGLQRRDLNATACHPGGAKVVDALEQVFELPTGGMMAARAILRDYGNMSAATVMFVLNKVLRDGAKGKILMSALGPGFTAGFLLLEAP